MKLSSDNAPHSHMVAGVEQARKMTPRIVQEACFNEQEHHVKQQPTSKPMVIMIHCGVVGCADFNV